MGLIYDIIMASFDGDWITHTHQISSLKKMKKHVERSGQLGPENIWQTDYEMKIYGLIIRTYSHLPIEARYSALSFVTRKLTPIFELSRLDYIILCLSLCFCFITSLIAIFYITIILVTPHGHYA